MSQQLVQSTETVHSCKQIWTAGPTYTVTLLYVRWRVCIGVSASRHGRVFHKYWLSPYQQAAGPVECWTARVFDSRCRRLCSIVCLMAWETRQEDIDDYSIALALLLNLVSSAHPPHSRSNSLLVIRVLLFYAVNPLMWPLILRFINVSPLTYCTYPATIGRFPSSSVSFWSNVVRFSFSDAKTFFSCCIFSLLTICATNGLCMCSGRRLKMFVYALPPMFLAKLGTIAL